ADSRDQAGRARQGDGDPRVHGGAAVRGTRAGIRRRRLDRRIWVRRRDPPRRMGGEGRAWPDASALPAVQCRRRAQLARRGVAGAPTLSASPLMRTLDLALIGNGAIGLLVDATGCVVW